MNENNENYDEEELYNTEEDFYGAVEDEDEYDNDDDGGDMSPDHPLIRRLQEGLKVQLDDLKDKLDVEMRDKSIQKTKLTKEREEIGVQLYTVQQQLAKLQVRLATSNEERAEYEQDRKNLEENLKDYRTELEIQQAELTHTEREYEQQRSELDKLNEIVLLLEQKNQDMTSEVAITKRKTYKSEQSASETESAKTEQDMYINKLAMQVKDISSELTVIEAQIIAQRSETKTARDALLQSSLEMEKINFERNQLVQDWKSSLIGIKLRTKTLQDLDSATAQQEEHIRTLMNEREGLKAQISDQQELNERNRSLHNKIKSRLAYLKNKIDTTKAERNSLQKNLNELNQIIQAKEQVISRLTIEKNSANSEFKLSQKGTNEISNKIHQIEDNIIHHVAEQSDLKRDAVSTQSMVDKIRQQIEEKDRELSDIQNEVMRLKIDKLNIVQQCQNFETGLTLIVDELREKDNLISQYESQIRRNNVDIEKRQSDVDKLNRKYEELTSAQNGEEYGPLERKIRQIQSRIQQSDETTAETQAVWLKKQTELVTLQKSCDEIQEDNASQQAHIAVLARKRDRTRAQVDTTEKDVSNLQVQIRLLQREMSSLGIQLSQSVGNGNSLVEGNVNFEADILEKLRSKEQESARAERQIAEVSEKREDLAEQMMETEKSIMMWEKKLALAREMKTALDPNYGASELKDMQKEISRMEFRLKQIRKQQDLIVKEMEFAMRRRETIANKGSVQRRINKDKTRVEISNGIAQLKRQARSLDEETKALDAAIQEDNDTQRTIGGEIEQMMHILRENKYKKEEFEDLISQEENRKILAQAKLEKLQQKSRLFQSQGGKTLLKSPDAFETAFAKVKHQEEQLAMLLDGLIADFPHLAKELIVTKEKLVSC